MPVKAFFAQVSYQLDSSGVTTIGEGLAEDVGPVGVGVPIGTSGILGTDDTTVLVVAGDDLDTGVGVLVGEGVAVGVGVLDAARTVRFIELWRTAILGLVLWLVVAYTPAATRATTTTARLATMNRLRNVGLEAPWFWSENIFFMLSTLPVHQHLP